MAGIVGIGGVFIHSTAPPALAEWYSKNLGITTEYSEDDDCFLADIEDPRDRHRVQFGIYPAQSPLATTGRAVMIHYQVLDLEGFLRQLTAKQVRVERVLRYEYGIYAYVHDPEGNAIELFEDLGA